MGDEWVKLHRMVKKFAIAANELRIAVKTGMHLRLRRASPLVLSAADIF
jgi:hypothetical protein